MYFRKQTTKGEQKSPKQENHNPGQNSWDTNAIARQIEASSLSPFLAPQHPEAFLRGRTRVNLAKSVFVPNFLKCLKTFWPGLQAEARKIDANMNYF